MTRRLLAISFIVNIFWIVCGCDKEEDKIEGIVDRIKKVEVDINEKIFQINNSSALKRLESIAYKEADTGNEERFKLVHISDPHISSYSVDNHCDNPVNLTHAVRFANQSFLRINALVATGDFIGYSTDKNVAIDYLKAFSFHFRKENTKPSVMCVGNHDNNYPPEGVDPTSITFDRTELNRILFSSDPNRPQNDRQENYYYLDVLNPQGGYIRIISLDMMDHAGREYDALHYTYYSQQQIDWLGKVALQRDITPEHSIIILNHFPLEPTTGKGKTSYLCDGTYVNSWQLIPEIVEAFRSRSSLQKTYLNYFRKKESITADFDFTGAKGEFICYLGGHAHCFACFDIKTISNRNSSLPPQKMILCTNQAPTDRGGMYTQTPRENKTITSNSFNIYAIDTKEKKVYITFFGANAPSHDAAFPDISSFSYLAY